MKKAKVEAEKNNNPYWVEDIILNYLEFHKHRVQLRRREDERELSSSPIRNFFWPVKNFIEAHKRDLHADIDWKRRRMRLTS